MKPDYLPKSDMDRNIVYNIAQWLWWRFQEAVIMVVIAALAGAMVFIVWG